MMPWFVVQTKPCKENDVAKRFTQAGIEVLHAKAEGGGRGRQSLFPNYVFICWDLMEGKNHHTVKYTRGVSKILGAAGKPVPISDAVIETIRERLDENGVLRRAALQKGSRVRIKKGLLKDLIAVLEKPVSADGRVAVLLKIYEREMRAKFSVKDVISI